MKQTKRFMAVLLLTGLLGAAPLFMEAAPAVRAKPDLLQKAAARYDMDSMCREVYKPYPGDCRRP